MHGQLSPESNGEQSPSIKEHAQGYLKFQEGVEGDLNYLHTYTIP